MTFWCETSLMSNLEPQKSLITPVNYCKASVNFCRMFSGFSLGFPFFFILHFAWRGPLWLVCEKSFLFSLNFFRIRISSVLSIAIYHEEDILKKVWHLFSAFSSFVAWISRILRGCSIFILFCKYYKIIKCFLQPEKRNLSKSFFNPILLLLKPFCLEEHQNISGIS